MMKICHEAVSVVGPLSSLDIVFYNGEIPSKPRMFFIISGALFFQNKLNGRFHELEGGRWICEHTLWVPWRHCGELRATTECRLLAIDAQTFMMLVASHFSTAGCLAGFHPSKYALEFVKVLNRTEVTDFSDITLEEDVEQCLEQAYPKIVRFNLVRESQVSVIPRQIIVHKIARWWWPNKVANVVRKSLGQRGSSCEQRRPTGYYDKVFKKSVEDEARAFADKRPGLRDSWMSSSSGNSGLHSIALRQSHLSGTAVLSVGTAEISRFSAASQDSSCAVVPGGHPVRPEGRMPSTLTIPGIDTSAAATSQPLQTRPRGSSNLLA